MQASELKVIVYQDCLSTCILCESRDGQCILHPAKTDREREREKKNHLYSILLLHQSTYMRMRWKETACCVSLMLLLSLYLFWFHVGESTPSSH